MLADEDYNASPAQEKRPARRRPITTLRPGETVRISLRGKHTNVINSWVGEIEAIDGVAVRIESSARRFDMYWERASGIVVIPWAAIERAEVQGEQ
jgi:hypothetical protein